MTDYTNYKDSSGFIFCMYCKVKVSFSEVCFCCQIGYATCRKDAHRPCPKCHRERNKKIERRQIGQNTNKNIAKQKPIETKNSMQKIQAKKQILLKCFQCNHFIKREQEIGNIIQAEKSSEGRQKLIICRKCCEYAQQLQDYLKKKSTQDKQKMQQSKSPQRQSGNLGNKNLVIDSRNNDEKDFKNKRIELKCVSCNQKIIDQTKAFSLQGLQGNQQIKKCQSCKWKTQNRSFKKDNQSRTAPNVSIDSIKKVSEGNQQSKSPERQIRNQREKNLINDNPNSVNKDFKNKKLQLKCVSCNQKIIDRTKSFSIQGLQGSQQIKICQNCKQETQKHYFKKDNQRRTVPKVSIVSIKKISQGNQLLSEKKQTKKQAINIQNKQQRQPNQRHNKVCIDVPYSDQNKKTEVQLELNGKGNLFKPKNNIQVVKKEQNIISSIRSKYKYKPQIKRQAQQTPMGKQLQATHFEQYIQDDQQQLKRNPSVKAKRIYEQDAILQDQFIHIQFNQQNEFSIVNCVDCNVKVQKQNAMVPLMFGRQDKILMKEKKKQKTNQDNIYMCKTCFVHQNLISKTKNQQKQISKLNLRPENQLKQRSNEETKKILIPQKQQRLFQKSKSSLKQENNQNTKFDYKQKNNFVDNQQKKIGNNNPQIQRRQYHKNQESSSNGKLIDTQELNKSPLYQYLYPKKVQNKDQAIKEKCKSCYKKQVTLGKNGYCSNCFMNIMAPSNDKSP